MASSAVAIQLGCSAATNSRQPAALAQRKATSVRRRPMVSMPMRRQRVAGDLGQGQKHEEAVAADEAIALVTNRPGSQMNTP